MTENVIEINGSEMENKENEICEIYEKLDNYDLTEILNLVEETIKKLLVCEDFKSSEAGINLRFIQRQTRYSSNVSIHIHVANQIVKQGIGHVFLRCWQSLSQIDYLNPDSRQEFRNLQLIVSIIWNCSDKSGQLCESLVRSSLVHGLLKELTDPKLLSDLANEKCFYLVKAFLGILHNIVRLCPESRKIFRTAGALRTLIPLSKLPNGLIRAKTYLILSYLISEQQQESDYLTMTDDLIGFLVSILQDALSCENHFSKEYAFWAVEIVCGLNHLAVNDLNKVRLGKAGVLGLYVRMLEGENVGDSDVSSSINGENVLENQLIYSKEQGINNKYDDFGDVLDHTSASVENANSENSNIFEVKDEEDECKREVQEERILAAAGIWILSFHPENKRILWSNPYFIKTISKVAATTNQENVARSLRGALWVIRSSPDFSLESREDSDQQHVMISYHWSHQKMMIILRNHLIKSGYKVWFDLDSMRGSTLEGMALAVERSAVVLVCLSQNYKNSPSCRTEAEYAFKLRKDIIPLLLQSDYNPDGWLGMLVGTKLYFDLTENNNTNNTNNKDSNTNTNNNFSPIKNNSYTHRLNFELSRLVRELGNRGRSKHSWKAKNGAVKKAIDYNIGENFSGKDINHKFMFEECGERSEMSEIDSENYDRGLWDRAVRVRNGNSNIVEGKGWNVTGRGECSSSDMVENICTPVRNRGLLSGREKWNGAVLLNSDNRGGVFKEKESEEMFNEPSLRDRNYIDDIGILGDTIGPFMNQELIPVNHSLHTYPTTYKNVNHFPPKKTKINLVDWKNEDVINWLQKNKLSYIAPKFRDFDGSSLIEYRKMFDRAPAYFYRSMEKHLKLDLVDMLSLSSTIERLKIN